MIGSIELKVNGTFHSGKYGPDFPKQIDMYFKFGDEKLGPFVLDMYHCTSFVPEVRGMAEAVVKRFPTVSNIRIETPTDEDTYVLFPFTIGVISVVFTRKGFNVETDFPVEEYYEPGEIAGAIDEAENWD